MSALLQIREFNDPGCPFGYSAEPHRRLIDWLYGDALETELTLVGLLEDPAELEARGFSVDAIPGAWRSFGERYGMPFGASSERHTATVAACRAVVAARVHGADHRLLMRWLRIRRFSGGVIDTTEDILAASEDAGLDRDQMQRWIDDEATERAVAGDFAAARAPSRQARALDHKLSDWAGGRRYPTPSWEITRREDGLTLSIPGFQPFEAYEVAIANLIPDVQRRGPASDPAEVLEWAGEPLATREVARVLDRSDEDAASALRTSGATEIELASGSFWRL